ncbi:hypothetical protein HAV38_02655 [Glaciimonas immobilis]|nr:hypothetical protein HAV38_02655 [Glaciimonas immobilis]
MHKDNASYPGNIQMLAKILTPSVRKVLGQKGNLLDIAIRQNVIDNVKKLSLSSTILSEAVEQKKLMIVGGVYKLASGKVELVKGVSAATKIDHFMSTTTK